MSAKLVIVGICGGTGSGKATLAERIVAVIALERALLIQQVNYYKDLSLVAELPGSR